MTVTETELLRQESDSDKKLRLQSDSDSGVCMCDSVYLCVNVLGASHDGRKTTALHIVSSSCVLDAMWTCAQSRLMPGPEKEAICSVAL